MLHVFNEMINAIGYPSRLIVGQEACDAAWLIVQHAISEPELKKYQHTPSVQK